MPIQTFRGTTGNGIPQATTNRYEAVIKDENDVVISTADINNLLLTYFLLDTPATIINTRNKQNVHNLNNCTLDTSGNLKWERQQEDNAIQGAAVGETEVHRAVFEFEYAGGMRFHTHEVDFVIRNVPTIANV